MDAPNLGKTATKPMFLEEAQPMKPSSSAPCLPPAPVQGMIVPLRGTCDDDRGVPMFGVVRRRNMGLCQMMRLRRITHASLPIKGVAQRAEGVCHPATPAPMRATHTPPSLRATSPNLGEESHPATPATVRSGNRASKMHKLTEPRVSAHGCAKPGENSDKANVPRRGTTYETVIISPMFAAGPRAGHDCASSRNV